MIQEPDPKNSLARVPNLGALAGKRSFLGTLNCVDIVLDPKKIAFLAVDWRKKVVFHREKVVLDPESEVYPGGSGFVINIGVSAQ